MFSNNEYAELEADHRRTLEQLEEARKHASGLDDELVGLRRDLARLVEEHTLVVQGCAELRTKHEREKYAYAHAVSTLAMLNGDYASALADVSKLLDNMVGSEDMEEVQEWNERFKSEIALARRVKAAVQK